jgi:hypothetical protein
MIIVSSESDETMIAGFFFRNIRFNGTIRSSSSLFSILSNRKDLRLDMKARIGEIVKLFRFFILVRSGLLHVSILNSEYFLKQK